MTNTDDLTAFRELFPELASTTDVIANARIAEGKQYLAAPQIGYLYAAAHLVATGAQNTGAADGGAGVVQEETIGPRKITYLNQVEDGRNDVFWMQSAYGRRFLTVRNSTARYRISAFVAG